MKIVLAVCTYRRPDSLRRLLESLERLAPPEIPDGFDFGRDFAVVVVDNDAAGAGLEVARSWRSPSGWTVHGFMAEEPGISAARNRAVVGALALAPEFVVFLDDDEWPHPRWLAELVRVQRAHGADLVGGPTLSVFPAHADERLRDNAYFGADLDIADGAACRLEAGGNFLARAALLEAFVPDVFHPDFARSGGEDLAFFTACARRGARMHWARDARVEEDVPPERLTPQWMRQRVINIANSRVHVMRRIDRGVGASLVRCTKTAGLCAVALGLSVAGLAHAGLRERARLLRWKFWGKFTAHLGRRTVRGETY